MSATRARGGWGLALAALAVLVVSSLHGEGQATPIYSIRSANACDTCHIEPLGWANPAESERFCTLDCNGCHYSPTGGGLRTPTGQYYGRQTIAMFGTRPGDFADPQKYKPEGFPDKGRYRLGEGFSGWWAGSTPMAQVTERFGDIDPDPKLSVGFDLRGAMFAPLEGGDEREVVAFPMQGDFYLMGRPLDNLVLYASAGLRGSRSGEYEDALDYLTVREAFVKLDRLPYNSYVRAGRFAPPYGWRNPDHTSFIRRDLGFDQNRQVFGVEGGYNPNYLFVNAAAFYQGLDAWPGDTGDEGVGFSAIGGWRDLGWQAFGSVHFLDRSQGPDEITAGAGWGLNLYPLVYMGEVDFRRQLSDTDGVEDADALFAYHELNWLVSRGVSALVKYDWLDPNLNFKDDHRDRYTVGLRADPFTYLQVDLQYRANLQALDFLDHEVLFILHGWL